MSENNVTGIIGAEVTTTGIIGATVAIGQYIINDYVITIAEAEGDYGYTMTITRGTDTQTVTLYGLTPEQYASMLGYLEQAQAAAQAAAGSASDAAAYMEAAINAANTANTQAGRATQASDTARSYASQAQTAKQGAETAKTDAQTARTQAQGYRQAAEAAATRAETAATRAETSAEEITGMTAEAETLEPGSPATASFLDGVLSLGIPAGANGAAGNGIVSIVKTGTSGNIDTYTITYTNGTTSTFTVRNGVDGAVTSVAGKTGAVTLDAGEVAFDDQETYNDGTVGAGLTNLLSHINAKADQTEVDEISVDVSDLQEKTLDFIEGSPTKFVEINNVERFAIKPQATAYYGGKNFFKFEDIPETTKNGITYSVTNGAITLNGIATSGTYIPLNAKPIPIASAGQANIKVWKDNGSVSGNISFRLFQNPNGSGTSYIVAPIYTNFPVSGNISDVELNIEVPPNNNGYLYFIIAANTSADNLIIRPMLTLADRYNAGDYAFGETPKKITEETVVRGAEYCCVQAHTDFSIVSEMAKTDSLQKSVYGMNIKASSGKILKILDGVPFSSLVSANTESDRIKVVGKNLINYRGWFEAITGTQLIYQPIALRPNTTYVFTNEGTDLTHIPSLQVRYGGITDTASTLLATILGAANVQEISFTTPDYDGLYYLRYYGGLCAAMRGGTFGDFSTMMLVEGDSPLEYFEEYVEADYLKNSARLSVSDISYIYTDNLDTVTVQYYSRVGSNCMPYYWQDYMDAKKMDLRKKLLSMSMHGLAFSFFTDVHIDENTCNSAYLLDYLRDEVGIPFKVFGGDLLNYSNNEETESIIQYYRFKKLYVNDKDTFCTPGNHDFYSPTGRSIFYNVLVKPIELLFDTNGYNTIARTYFYIDNSSQKVRMIFLDSNDWSSEKPAMFNWYVETLNSIPNGWDCVIFSHILGKGDHFGNDIPFFAQKYNDRASGSRALGDGSGTISYDFTAGTGKVICAIGGHSHKDYSNTDFGFPVILTTTDCIGGVTVEHPTVTMTRGTTTENAFDVFFIDLDAKTIDAIRIGAGEDRQWTY